MCCSVRSIAGVDDRSGASSKRDGSGSSHRVQHPSKSHRKESGTDSRGMKRHFVPYGIQYSLDLFQRRAACHSQRYPLASSIALLFFLMACHCGILCMIGIKCRV